MMDLDWVGEKGGQVCGIINPSLHTRLQGKEKKTKVITHMMKRSISHHN